MAKKFWLKLSEHFFDEDEILFLKSQDNGYEYIYLWQRLLLKCLKIDDEHSGFLRFNDKLPYKPELLAEIFKMNVDVVRVGMKLLQELGMIDILDDGTIYIESVQMLIGKESESTERVRKHRERKKLIENNTVTGNVTNVTSNDNIEVEVKKSREEIESELLSCFGQYWNEKEIIKHTHKAIERNCKKRHFDILGEYEESVIKKGIDNYKSILSSPEYFFKYKWSFWDFIVRGLEKFIDDADPFSNFRITPIKEPIEYLDPTTVQGKKGGKGGTTTIR